MVLIEIVDVYGFPKCFFCNLFWSVIENIYYEKEMKNNNESIIFGILKSSLQKQNTWGVFIHYLIYHANNYNEKKDFIIYISDLEDEESTILNTNNFYETCSRLSLDEYIIQEFIKFLFPNIIFFHQDNNDNGHIKILLQENENNANAKYIDSFLKKFGFNINNNNNVHVSKSTLYQI